MGWARYKIMDGKIVKIDGDSYEYSDDALHFAVFRHPVQRWISGITQTFHAHHGHDLKLLYRNIVPFLEDPWFDQHQAPQCLYLYGVTKGFKLESIDRLREWLGGHGVTLPPLIHKNKTEEYRGKRAVYDHVADNLTPDRVRLLEEYYADDLLLYQSAE